MRKIILLVEDNEFNRELPSRRHTGVVERMIPLRAYGREEFVRDVAHSMGASVARGAPPGEEMLR